MPFYYASGGGGTQGPAGPPGPEGPPGGAYLAAYWQYNSSVATPPGSGQLRTPSPVDMLYLSEVDADGFDRSTGLGQIAVGDQILVKSPDGSSAMLQVRAAPTDQGTWRQIPITILSGDPNAKKGTRVEIGLIIKPGGMALNSDFSMSSPATQYLAKSTVVEDASDTATWPDRFVFYFDPISGAPVRTGYHNEYGELRARPAKPGTVPFRVMSYAPTGGSTGNLLEVASGDAATKYLEVSQSQAKFGVPISAPNISPPAPTWPLLASNVGWQNIQRGGVTPVTPTLNRHFAVPFRVPVATTLTKLMLDISTAAGAGGTYRVGLYSSDPTGLFPQARISEIGNGVTTVQTTLFHNFTAIPLAPNMTYWITFVAQVNIASGPLALRGRSDNNPLIVQTNAAIVLSTAMSCQFRNNIAGALPDPFGAVDGQTQGPEFALWFV